MLSDAARSPGGHSVAAAVVDVLCCWFCCSFKLDREWIGQSFQGQGNLLFFLL